MSKDKDRFIYKNINQIEKVPTSHAIGYKQIVSRGFKAQMQINQIAVGILNCGENIKAHIHNDMDECYYVLEGEGHICFENECFKLEPETVINVPANTSHSIKCTSAALRFFYFCLEIK